MQMREKTSPEAASFIAAFSAASCKSEGTQTWWRSTFHVRIPPKKTNNTYDDPCCDVSIGFRHSADPGLNLSWRDLAPGLALSS